MKVLTVWQPWASLIAIGAKPYEFRGGLPPRAYVGQRIAIHAGKRKPVAGELAELIQSLEADPSGHRHGLKTIIALPFLEAAWRHPERLPLGMILCTAILGSPKDGWDIAAEFGAQVNDSDRHEKANFGWPLTDLEDVVPPVEHRGKQGWSEWVP